MNRLKVISFWAGPGAGKSTIAAGLFYQMKQDGYSVELVTEVYKDWTWENNTCRLGDRLLGIATQNHRLQRLEGQVEYAITDSPIPLTLAYCNQEERSFFSPIVRELWDRYQNFGYIVNRNGRPYKREGRSQCLEEAIDLDRKIEAIAWNFRCTNWKMHRGATNWIPGIGAVKLDRGSDWKPDDSADPKPVGKLTWDADEDVLRDEVGNMFRQDERGSYHYIAPQNALKQSAGGRDPHTGRVDGNEFGNYTCSVDIG